ncbi:uncharacterized protein LOC100680229 [Nasonia vitripennis]|uniref:Uncharacterized protein n=1 Tax=Nasonia vitripennis TaxID=7425 RepID=A0A7M7GHY9_NASVI|nr:uncharacterized protein LOC100680229 [Nasonia vitripennis]XP_008207372.1 uncharacterized protein LOC100680229 [Nasonia vitripennis]
MMFKTTIIAVGFLFCLILKTHGSAQIPFTKQWDANYTFSPNVVKVNNRLLVVGLQNNTVVVNSTFGGNQSNTCEHDFFNPDEYTFDETEVTALGNGKIVINTVLTSNQSEGVSNGLPARWRLLLILDPFDCSTLKKVELRKDKEFSFEALVPYHDSFDVFQYNISDENVGESKKPQRYNDQGEQMQLDHSIDLENDCYIMKIETIEPYDASKGYICSIRKGDNEYFLRFLDSSFGNVKQVATDGSIQIYTWSATHGAVNYCYTDFKRNKDDAHEIESQNVFCKLMDPELKSKALVELPNPDNVIRIYDIIAINLPDGGALVIVDEDDIRAMERDPMKIRVHHINADGTVREPADILAEKSLFYRYYVTDAILLNDELCFVNAGSFLSHEQFNPEKNHVWIDCVQVSSL